MMNSINNLFFFDKSIGKMSNKFSRKKSNDIVLYIKKRYMWKEKKKRIKWVIKWGGGRGILRGEEEAP